MYTNQTSLFRGPYSYFYIIQNISICSPSLDHKTCSLVIFQKIPQSATHLWPCGPKKTWKVTGGGARTSELLIMRGALYNNRWQGLPGPLFCWNCNIYYPIWCQLNSWISNSISNYTSATNYTCFVFCWVRQVLQRNSENFSVSLIPEGDVVIRLTFFTPPRL
jgi:hypothetical protein